MCVNLLLGEIFVVGLVNFKYGCEIMKECIEEVVFGVIYELECYFNVFGIIVVMVLLLGLLGMVFGMI